MMAKHLINLIVLGLLCCAAGILLRRSSIYEKFFEKTKWLDPFTRIAPKGQRWIAMVYIPWFLIIWGAILVLLGLFNLVTLD